MPLTRQRRGRFPDDSPVYLESKVRIADESIWFTWGAVTKVHRIGDTTTGRWLYEIVEYTPNRSANVLPKDHDDSPMFHPYIDGEDTNHSYRSLDAALAGAIAIRHEGINAKADRYFMRMIGAAS